MKENDNEANNNFDNFDANQNININGDINNSESLNVNQAYNASNYYGMSNNMNQQDGPQAQASAQEGQPSKHQFTDFVKKSAHPSEALITVALKVASLFFFLFLNIFTSNEAIVMIVVIILDAMDFWFTKNIAGRKLVGLRWWNSYDPETQQEKWTFESKNEIKEASIDRNTFWISLYGFTAAWLILFIFECIVLSFMWAFLCAISLAISGTNTYGFFRCSKLQQKGAKIVLTNFIKGRQNKNT
jgi:hypothetical protein